MKKMTIKQFKNKYPRIWFLFRYGAEFFLIVGAIMLGAVLYETYAKINRDYLFWAGLILIMAGLLIKEAIRD